MKLGMESQFNESWCRKQTEKFQHSDTTPHTMMDGTVFEKTLALACPVCGAVFFTYQPRDTPYPPYTDPGASLGPLQACGDPRCHLESEKRWLRKDGTFHAFCLKYFDDLAIKGGAKAPDLKPKLVKLGER